MYETTMTGLRVHCTTRIFATLCHRINSTLCFRKYCTPPSSTGQAVVTATATTRLHGNEKYLQPFKFCVIGAGPAGFYTVESLLKTFPRCTIDILERLPVPFGLVRYGVAPDHPDVKLVENKFQELLLFKYDEDTPHRIEKRVRYFGNVKFGTMDDDDQRRYVDPCPPSDDSPSVCSVPSCSSIQVQDVSQCYDAMVISTGAQSDRRLFPDTQGVMSSRDFVSWYNGHPDFVHRGVDLSVCKTVVINGVGNVSIDILRMLISPVSRYEKTDASSYAVDALRKSQVEKVVVLGRRGVVQASWTPKELREVLEESMTCTFQMDRKQVEELSGTDEAEMKSTRPKKRCVEILQKYLKQAADLNRDANHKTKVVELRFLTSITKLLTEPSPEPNTGKPIIRGIELCKNLLKGEAHKQYAVRDERAEVERMQCDLLIESLGYKGMRLSGLPFDDKQGVIPHCAGRVLMSPDDVVTVSHGASSCSCGVYVSGWIKRGPSGIIGSNKWDAEETVMTIAQDVKQGLLTRSEERRDMLEILQDKQIEYVTEEGWERINKIELERGKEKGKIREKLVNVEEMMRAAKQDESK